MGNLFGVRRRAPQVTEQDKVILQLKQQRDKIKIYQKRTESELTKNKEIASRLYNEKKIDRALIILRRKKLMEETLSRTDQQLETLEGLVHDIEFSQIQVSVVEGLRVGNEALKHLNSLISIEDIEKILEENDEAAEKQKEISKILHGASERYDESELLKELEERQISEKNKDAEKQPEEETNDKNIDEANLKKVEETKTGIEISNLPELPELPEIPTEKPKSVIETKKQKEHKNEERLLELAS